MKKKLLKLRHGTKIQGFCLTCGLLRVIDISKKNTLSTVFFLFDNLTVTNLKTMNI